MSACAWAARYQSWPKCETARLSARIEACIVNAGMTGIVREMRNGDGPSAKSSIFEVISAARKGSTRGIIGRNRAGPSSGGSGGNRLRRIALRGC